MCVKYVNIRSLCAVLCTLLLVCSGALVYATESDSTAQSDPPVPVELASLHESALNGSAESQFKLGKKFEYGQGVEQSDSEAAFWYEKSAAQGFTSAQYRLAILCDNGWGGPVDKVKAFTLYKAAAEKGVELAQHDLAIVYYQGSGTAKNLVLAYKWLKIADLSGNPLMQKHLSLVAAEMSPEEIKTGKYFAEIWVDQSGKSF